MNKKNLMILIGGIALGFVLTDTLASYPGFSQISATASKL
jgi:hypothetical protein